MRLFFKLVNEYIYTQSKAAPAFNLTEMKTLIVDSGDDAKQAIVQDRRRMLLIRLIFHRFPEVLSISTTVA